MITANLNFSMPWEAYRQVALIPTMAKRLLPQGDFNGGPPLKTRVNLGRWLIDCECGGAELAFEEGPFMCQSCWNAKHKHQYRMAVFPSNRQAIEEALIQRPEQNRNWWPGESVTQLKSENAAHKEELL